VISGVKKCRPDAKIVLGGAFVREQEINNGAESFEVWMRKHGIDYVLYSANSERDLVDLVRALKNGSGVKDVHNLASLSGITGLLNLQM
jgi:hypothetical protein